MLHLQKIVRRALDVLADLVSVRRPMEKRPQDEHVQCAMENGHALRSLFSVVANRPSIANDGSHSTIVMSSEDGKLRSRVTG
jgi:hypothetical protein